MSEFRPARRSKATARPVSKPPCSQPPAPAPSSASPCRAGNSRDDVGRDSERLQQGKIDEFPAQGIVSPCILSAAPALYSRVATTPSISSSEPRRGLPTSSVSSSASSAVCSVIAPASRKTSARVPLAKPASTAPARQRAPPGRPDPRRRRFPWARR